MKHSRSILAVLLTFFVSTGCFGQYSEQFISQRNVTAFQLKESDLAKAFGISNELLRGIGKYSDSLKSDIYSVRGTLHQEKQEYAEALNFHLKSLRIRHKIDDLTRIANSYCNIANTYYYIGDFKLSKKYHLKSLKIVRQKFGEGPRTVRNYNGIGSLYLSVDKNDSAYYYYSKALKIIDNYDMRQAPEAADVFLNMGILEEDKGHLDLAMTYLKQASELQKKMNDLSGLSKSLHHIGIVCELQNDFFLAKSYYKKALELAAELGNFEGQRDVNGSFVKVYNKEGLQDSTDYFFDQYIRFNHEFLRRANDEAVRRLEVQYQTERKDNEIRLYKVQRKADSERLYFITTAFILSSLLLLTFFYFLIRTYRQKQRIALMQVDLKNREITDLLNQQESTAYAAMLEGQDRERLRIARDLHDRLGSTLAAVKLGLQSDPVTLNTQNQQLVDSAITEVRSVAHNLSGMNIERYGLNVALYELKIRIERTGKINMELYLDETPPGIELSVELYRVVQELVSNTLKHADAQTITLQTSHRQQQFNLIYEDDGQGFDPAATQEGMGIRNIRHRLGKLNGHLDIDAQPGRGTIMNIHITLNPGL